MSKDDGKLFPRKPFPSTNTKTSGQRLVRLVDIHHFFFCRKNDMQSVGIMPDWLKSGELWVSGIGFKTDVSLIP
jgi:hypothetical protein